MRKFKSVPNHSIQRIKGIVFSVLPLSLLFAIWHQPQTQYFQWIQQEDDNWSTSCCIYCLFGSWMIHRVLGNFGMLHNQTLLFEAKSQCNIWPSTVKIDFEFGWALQSSKLHCNNGFFSSKDCSKWFAIIRISKRKLVHDVCPLHCLIDSAVDTVSMHAIVLQTCYLKYFTLRLAQPGFEGN